MNRSLDVEGVNCIEGVNLVDVAAGEVVEARDIHMHQGRVAEICAAGKGPSTAKKLDGRGLFAIPGLIDAHMHAFGIYLQDLGRPWDVRWFARQMRQNLRATLLSGVTTVRDMGAPTRLALHFRKRERQGRLLAPRLLVSGAMITAPGGYPHFVPAVRGPLRWLLGGLRHDVSTPAEAHAAVDRLASQGVDVVKTFWSSMKYDDERSPLPLLAPGILAAIQERAAYHGLPVAVHSTWQTDLDGLLDQPLDTLEHLPIDAPISEAQAARIATLQIPVSTTLMTYGIIDHLDELEALLASPDAPFENKPWALMRSAVQSLKQGRQVTEDFGMDVLQTGSVHARVSLLRLHEAGALIALGTDSGGAITPCGQIAWELEDIVRAGLSPLDALRAGTEGAATALRRPDLGHLRPGATADVVLLRENPLDDISAVRQVMAVIKEGSLVSS